MLLRFASLWFLFRTQRSSWSFHNPSFLLKNCYAHAGHYYYTMIKCMTAQISNEWDTYKSLCEFVKIQSLWFNINTNKVLMIKWWTLVTAVHFGLPSTSRTWWVMSIWEPHQSLIIRNVCENLSVNLNFLLWQRV